jgi:hypothetical protein
MSRNVTFQRKPGSQLTPKADVQVWTALCMGGRSRIWRQINQSNAQHSRQIASRARNLKASKPSRPRDRQRQRLDLVSEDWAAQH